MTDVLEMEKIDPKVKEDYFGNFIKECLRDLKCKKKTFTFNTEQVKEIQRFYPKIKIEFNNDVYYLSI